MLSVFLNEANVGNSNKPGSQHVAYNRQAKYLADLQKFSPIEPARGNRVYLETILKRPEPTSIC